MKGPDVGKANHAPPPFSIRMGRAGGGADVGTRGQWRARNEMGSSFGSISALIGKKDWSDDNSYLLAAAERTRSLRGIKKGRDLTLLCPMGRAV